MKTEAQITEAKSKLEHQTIPQLLNYLQQQIGVKDWESAYDLLLDLMLNIAALQAAERVLES